MTAKTADGALDESWTGSVGISSFSGSADRVPFDVALGPLPKGALRAEWTNPRPDQGIIVTLSGTLARNLVDGQVQAVTPLPSGGGGASGASAADYPTADIGTW